MPSSSFTILTYHRIATPGGSELSPTLIDAYPPDFEAQMRFVAQHYSVISFWDVLRALRGDYELPRRALVITFDDGYRSFSDTAMPVLRRLGLPVTLFVPTAFIENPTRLFWWDAVYRALARTKLEEIDLPGLGHFSLRAEQERLATYERIVPIIEQREACEAERLVASLLDLCGVEPNHTPYLLGWDEVEVLAAEGVAVGPHTRQHPILSRVGPERAWAEIEGSWRDLKGHLRPSSSAQPLPILCYPNGQPHAVNGAAKEAARRAGLVGAVTMVAGLNVAGTTDPFIMHRYGSVAGESLPHFRLKLGPAGRIYRRVKALLTRKPLPAFDI
jgi:peptidoglycan/xylan/chitin deacetylase (PgdA/CDA1 family)